MIAASHGTFYDGQAAAERSVSIALDAVALRFEGPEQVPTAWTLRGLRLIDRPLPGAALRLTHAGSPSSRLTIADAAFAAELLPRLPYAKGRFIGSQIARPLAWLAGSLMAITLLGFLVLQLAPDVLAAVMPERWRQALGDWSERNLVGPAGECRNAEGRSSLTALAGRFGEARPDLPPLAIRVYDIPVMNAFALPGDRIVITRGLIDKAGTPEEVAGVLAHEIGHAVNRHSEAQVIRAVGLHMLFSLLSNGQDAGSFAGLAAELRYSRDAENAADDYAQALLTAARIDPMGLKRFFELVLKEEQEMGSNFWNWASVLSTHPGTGDRIEKIVPLPEGVIARPALDKDGWQALKAICE